MKKLLLLCLSLSLFLVAQAISINLTNAGTLTTVLSATEKSTTTYLTVTGNIDASDVRCMREEMTKLAILDIRAVNIVPYNGSAGTSTAKSYPANEMPASSFFNVNLGGKHTLKSVILPTSITSIAENAFCNCDSLTEITIPTSVTSIGVNSFIFCNSFQGFLVQSGNQNFSSVDGVLFNKDQTSIIQYPNGKSGSYTIPATVKSIETSAFTASNWLTDFFVDATNTNFSAVDGILFNKDKTILIQYPSGRSGAYTVPDFVNSISYGAFSRCSKLSSVIIGDNVTTISISAFSVCEKLDSVTLGKSVASIGDNAFAFCGKLTKFVVNAANPNFSTIDGVLFNKNQTSLVLFPVGKTGTYTIPNSVTTIGTWAFYSSKLSGVTIPTSVASIGNSSFFSSRLSAVTIPNSVKTIGNDAFGSCSALTSIVIPNSVTSVGNSAFAYCTGLTSVTLSNSITEIANSTFDNCAKLTSIIIPSSVKTIGTNAFQYCGLNEIIDIPNSVTAIGDWAFVGCYSLKGITIGNSVTSIGFGTFWGCIKVSSINIPKSVSSIGSYAFFGCGALSSISAFSTIPINLSSSVDVFNGVNKTICILNVPIGSKTSYQSAAQWKDFANINETISGLQTQSVESVKLYPNPVIDGFRVVGLNGDIEVKVIDYSGKTLIDKHVFSTEFISLKTLPSGIYVIKLISNNNTIERKVLKL
jgi:hypothetical protein